MDRSNADFCKPPPIGDRGVGAADSTWPRACPPQYNLIESWARVERPVLETRLEGRVLSFVDLEYDQQLVNFRQLASYGKKTEDARAVTVRASSVLRTSDVLCSGLVVSDNQAIVLMQ